MPLQDRDNNKIYKSIITYVNYLKNIKYKLILNLMKGK